MGAVVTGYGSTRVDDWIDAAPSHRLTEDDFALAAVACADQAGVDVATQEEIRRLIEASRARAVVSRPLMHHRRFASGRRSCDLDGQNPAANGPGNDDTHDPASVDCPMCIEELRGRGLLPDQNP